MIERATASLVRRRRRERRLLPRMQSLHLLVDVDGELRELGSGIIEDRRRGVRQPDPVELAATAAVVAAVSAALETLPARLRDLAERLKSRTVSQAARDLGLPRSTVQRRVDALRRALMYAGLAELMR